MYTRVQKLKVNYNDYILDPLWVILDQHASPPILPLLFTTYLSQNGIVYESRDISDETSRKRVWSLVANEISDNTIRSYVYSLSRFLSYLDYCHQNKETPNMHSSSGCSERFLNHYLNQKLANELGVSRSLETHKSALVAYYNFLNYMGISNKITLKIYRKTKQKMAEKSDKQSYIQYVSRHSRFLLLNYCETLGEKLMMRMGYEVGLRTSELMGLITSGKNNLISIFDQLDHEDYSHVNKFRYRLEGRYTKGDKSRWIYFERNLLIDMKRYFETERKYLINLTGSDEAGFFLRVDQRFKGTGISQEQATRVFRKRAKAAGLNSCYSFHDLRHTFATELFHEELTRADGRETRSESAALIVVSQRLGHAIGRDGCAPPVTTRYIRMRLEMSEIEEVPYG